MVLISLNKICNFIHYFILQFQSQSSPRRVAVPVLVKDGKPCSNSSDSQSRNQNQQSIGNHCNAHSPNLNQIGSAHQPPNQHQLQPQQHQQPTCNSTSALITNMTSYPRPNLQHHHHHQQQTTNMCSAYLPLQGRAW